MIPETKEQLNALAEKTRTSFIQVNPIISEDIPVKASKIGGVPYWKQSMPYPQIEGKIVKLMAQINFDDLAKKGLSLPEFPEKGILQFYFAKDDDMWGLTFDGSESKIKVVYHEDTTEQAYITKQILKVSEDNEGMPYEEACILKFEKASELLSFTDEYQASKQYDFDTNILSDDLTDYMHEEFANAGSKVGGYAYFTQSDPRTYGEQAKKDWILLLQIDTEDDANIMWGDCGVANWFIDREDLKKRDFSKVLFNWDCC